MIFKNDKKLLKIIKSQKPQLSNGFYDWNDIYIIANMSESSYLISLRNLEKENIISFSSKTTTAFRLEANGLYFREFQWNKCKQYIADKLIDFIAVIVSVVALVLSILTSLNITPSG